MFYELNKKCYSMLYFLVAFLFVIIVLVNCEVLPYETFTAVTPAVGGCIFGIWMGMGISRYIKRFFTYMFGRTYAGLIIENRRNKYRTIDGLHYYDCVVLYLDAEGRPVYKLCDSALPSRRYTPGGSFIQIRRFGKSAIVLNDTVDKNPSYIDDDEKERLYDIAYDRTVKFCGSGLVNIKK